MPTSVMMISDNYLPSIGGVATHVHQLAQALGKAGATVRVIVPNRVRASLSLGFGTVMNEHDGVVGCEIRIPATPGGIGEYWWLRTAIQKARGKLFGNDRLTVHCHDHGLGKYAAKCMQGCPQVSTNHTSGFLQAADRGELVHLRSHFDGIHQVIAPSAELRDVTIQTGVNPAVVKYIPNGVDCDRFCPNDAERAEVRARLGIALDDVVIMCARRWVPKNGVIDFAHCLQFLGKIKPRVRVVFAGNNVDSGDSYEAEVVGALNRSGMMDRCILLGSVPNDEIRQYYRASDVSVLPSLKEATSISGLESMACALPLVGTRIGGIPDLIEEGSTGLLVEAGDTRGLADALTRLIDDRDFRSELSRGARQRAVNCFSWSRIAEATLATYDEAAIVAHAGR